MNEPMTEPMNEVPVNHRAVLVRKAVVLQLKLLVDGLRDAVLIPVALAATFLGLLRGGEDADREFRRVIKLGIRSEHWINLFGHQPRSGRIRPGGSLDQLLERVEAVVVEEYSKGRNTAEARAAIRAALDVTPEDDSRPDQPVPPVL